MKDKVFIDSNIAIYALFEKAKKGQIALKILENNPIISTQVVSETINVGLKKLKLSKENTFDRAIYLMNFAGVITLENSTYFTAFEISIKYKFSFWDSLIIASALESNCSILYSEDLQHKQVIENKLEIINPFV